MPSRDKTESSLVVNLDATRARSSRRAASEKTSGKPKGAHRCAALACCLRASFCGVWMQCTSTCTRAPSDASSRTSQRACPSSVSPPKAPQQLRESPRPTPQCHSPFSLPLLCNSRLCATPSPSFHLPVCLLLPGQTTSTFSLPLCLSLRAQHTTNLQTTHSSPARTWRTLARAGPSA